VQPSVWWHVGTDRIALFGLVIWIGLLALAIVAPLLPLPSYEDMNLERPLSLPSPKHWLGTDSFGRDTLSRVVYGARVSMASPRSLWASPSSWGPRPDWRSGTIAAWWTPAVSRFMDGVMSFPPLLLAIAPGPERSASARNVAIALAVVYVPRFTRVTRASVLGVAELEYIQAATPSAPAPPRSCSDTSCSNIAGPIIVQGRPSYAYAIIAEAG